MSLQSFIILFVATILTGVLSVVLAKAKIRKEWKDFDSFVEHVAGFVTPKASRKSVSMHINYISANY